jgi:hypothetical protein
VATEFRRRDLGADLSQGRDQVHQAGAGLRSLGSRGSAGITDADLLSASFSHGIKAVQTAEGVKLDIPRSGTMSFRQAVASGLIKVSRGR